jgi:hypothetical protein
MYTYQSSRTWIDYFLFLFFITDRNQTVSQRSKPNSRAFLTNEQLDP